MPGYESPPGPHGRFTLKVLGGFALSWDGRALQVSRASQRLLAFLALQTGMLKRVAVAGTLWPEASESHASSNLRSALARLQGTARKALAASKLELGLAEGIVVDIRSGQGLARRLLDRAVTPDRAELGMASVPVLSADLLPDWYDDWVVVEAEDWRRLRLHALEALAARLIALGRWGEAAHAAGAAVRAEPLRESARAALIQAHLAEGNQSEAVREFARYRRLLDAELGLAPTSRLHDLLQHLQSPQRCHHCHGVTVGS
jgi:SARP family transcriptional regulator, regulator of embCAB operon